MIAKRPWLAYCIACFSACIVATDLAAGDSRQDSSGPRALTDLLAWLPGDYSNAAMLQLLLARNARLSKEVADAKHLTTYIRRVELPVFGKHVLFLEEYRGVDRTQLERIRLYVFDADGNGIVHLRLLNPTNAEALQGARNDLSLLQALAPADVGVDRSVCELSFSELPDSSIVGRMATHACDRNTEWVDYELHVRPDDHWVCYSRRSKSTDAVTWQQVPTFPCVLMNRINSVTQTFP